MREEEKEVDSANQTDHEKAVLKKTLTLVEVSAPSVPTRRAVSILCSNYRT